MALRLNLSSAVQLCPLRSASNCKTDCKIGAGVAAAKATAGRYGEGDGLARIVTASGSRKWVCRFTWRGKVTEMGLGSDDVAGLAEARDLRDDLARV